MTIWKFPIRITDLDEVSMPVGAKVLCVQVQDGQPCIWALVDPVAPVELRSFRTYGTGHPMTDLIPGADEYVGTYQVKGGDLVFHVFARARA